MTGISDYRFHPALLDTALHILVHPVLTGNRDTALYYLPAKVGAIDIHQTMLEKPFPKTFFAHATFSRWSPESLSYNFTIVDDEGSVLCQIKELEAALHGHRMMKVEKIFEVSYSRTGLSVGSHRDPVTEIPEIADPSISRSDADDVFRQEPYRPRSGTNTTDSGYSTSSGVTCQAISPQLSNTSSVHVIEYVRGKEMEIREMVIKLDPIAELFIWFFASAGLDGDACLGFTRSLRREYQSWTVQVAVFDLAWTPAERSHAMQDLMAYPDCELEMFVDSTGFISVPRIVLAAPPSNRVPFDATLPWHYDGSELKQISKPAIPDEHILVRVTSATKNAELWAFCGVADGFSKPVIGITDGGLSNIVVAHRGSLVELETTWDACQADIHGPPVLAAAIAALAVGTASFSHPERLRKSLILVTHSDTEPGSHIVQLYSHLGLRVSTLSSSIDTADLERLYAQRPSIIVSGATDVSQWQVLQDLLPRHGKLFLWNHPEYGVANLLTTDPWSVGDALRCALHCSAVVAELFLPPLQLLDIPQVETVLATDVFDHQKSYLLVGGIGSLGLQIALWMYENGAREIVLTSRSGPESLVKREEFIARRLLTYLEGLPDLTLRTEAVDAQSTEEMAALVGHLDRPLGGCMLLSAVLNDRTFASQTTETFEAPFGPKVGAFEVLEHVVAVESLDFLITFSSVSGMFGNAGQTNYASANTALSGLTRKYKNAMSIVAPVILDSGISLGSDVVQNARLRHLSNWGMTARDLCDYIEDGIRKLREGPIWQYIPDFDWGLVHANMGPSTMYDHLLPAPEANLPKDHANSTTDSIRHIVCKVLDMKSEDLSSEVPLTAYGLDSLSAASLSHALRPLIAVSQFQLLADLTLRQLESRLEADRDAESDSSQATDAEQGSDDVMQGHIRDMVALVDKYASDIPYREPVQLHDTTAPVILITGTTGSLGAHVLARLLQSPTPRKIYAFLRKGKDDNPVMHRQIQAFKSRGLPSSVLASDRLVLVEGTLHESSMGLSPSLWDELYESVTHIVHLGWPVDFGTSLASFEPAIQGLRNLVDLASRSNNRPPAKIIFGSSSGIFRSNSLFAHSLVSSIPNNSRADLDSTQPAQEAAIHDPAVAVDSGYSESKWVAERLLSVAVERHAIHATIVRIGQLTGGLNGAWKTSEWIPSLVSASAALGCLPEGSGVVSWLPVDTAAAALVDMLDSPRPIVHLRHPRPVPWSTMMQHFASSLRVPLVPYAQWIARLEEGWADARARDRRYLEHAVRLQDFFRSARAGAGAPGLENNGLSVLMAMDAGVGVSETLRDPALPLLGAAEVEKWMGYWREIGFLPA
ncbi:L-aminoadipate-semialdehyde dehydrogenase large subunit [Grifola frondosa]|uniref:L-aminoadipate-semialdehyde dehydrogenase large subunit n=1 Tax=Grifola frondosa TaxID=5627 RepID=A0A1C7LL73_GRIFR|nr:L-aminoadipate-semialdehyde dehydrogenase large subunit [Grifola frondosa]